MDGEDVGRGLFIGLFAGALLMLMIYGLPQLPFDQTPTELSTQQSMAHTAWLTLIITGLSTVIGVIGIVAVLRTLKYSRVAAEVATRALIADHRAWLKPPDIAKITAPLTWIPEQAFSLSVNPRFENIGASPAIDASVNLNFFIGLNGLERAKQWLMVVGTHRGELEKLGTETVFPEGFTSSGLGFGVGYEKPVPDHGLGMIFVAISATYRLANDDQIRVTAGIYHLSRQAPDPRIHPSLGPIPVHQLKLEIVPLLGIVAT